jgi:hypothetical protein
MAIEFKTYKDFEDALAAHKKITGTGFFDGYENSKAPRLKIIESGRVGDWMVDRVTGDIYYIYHDGRNGLRLLNKLSLGMCLDDALFQRVELDNGVMFIGDAKYSKTNMSRRLLGKMEWIVATGMAPTGCDDCLRLSDCDHWANYGQHDQHPPCRCERFTTDQSVLDREAAILSDIRAAAAMIDDSDIPF